MVGRARAGKWPGAKGDGPREIEPSAADPRSTERQLGAIPIKGSDQGGEFQSATANPRSIFSENHEPDPNGVLIEGWVAGLPVVGGVADSGWTHCDGGRVRLVVYVKDSHEQREWVRAMAYGGAYAKEVLG